MDINEQLVILRRLSIDAAAQVGTKVNCELCPKKTGGTSKYLYCFAITNQKRRRVSAYGQIKPRIGCPRINIKTKYLKNASPNKINLFDPPRNSMFGEADGGRRIEIHQLNGATYIQALYALSEAIKACL